jgi:hypothetical protein
MKKIIVFVCITIIFIGIGFGVKRYVEGPSQPANGIVVSGTEQDINKVEELYKGNIKQTANYKIKYVTTNKLIKLSEEDQKEMNQEFETRAIQYAVVNQSTAKELMKKEVLRVRKDPKSWSTISDPVTDIKDLSSGHNLYFSMGNAELKNNQLDLNGQMLPMQHAKPQMWIGYRPMMDLVILTDKAYNEITEEESNLKLIQFKNKRFDYKNKKEVDTIFKEIEKVYPNSEEKVNFVDLKG